MTLVILLALGLDYATSHHPTKEEQLRNRAIRLITDYKYARVNFWPDYFDCAFTLMVAYNNDEVDWELSEAAYKYIAEMINDPAFTKMTEFFSTTTGDKRLEYTLRASQIYRAVYDQD